MMRRLLNLSRDRSGTAVVELALAAPVLATLVIGMTDLSMAYSRKLQLEQAAQRAIEKVAQTTGEDTPENTIKKEAVCQFNGTKADGTCNASPLLATDVAVTYSLKCDGVVKAYNLDCTGGQTEIRYISTTVSNKYVPMFPIKFNTNSDGTYHLAGVAGVRVQ